MKSKGSSSKKTRRREVIVDVTEADYRKELARGVDENVAIRPGRHVFRGMKRRIPPESFEAKNTKIKINMYVDGDIVAFFKQRAAAPHAAPYQTQMNRALREYMEGKQDQESLTVAKLLRSEKLITALAERVRRAL